jgi:putative hydrolase of the HAD superfamily
MTTAPGYYKGLLLDFGGVLTSDFFGSIDDYCQRLGLPRGRFRALVTTDPAGTALYHRVERGEISQARFERELGALLGVAPDGLVAGLLAGLRPDPQMVEAVARARKAGIRVGVITNSWGTAPYDPYEGYQLNERFDALVVSGEVGIRKPDPAIYRLAADKLGVPPSRCVFVDDVAANLPAAAELGMATVHHVDSSTTVAELERLLRLPLASRAVEHPAGR